MSAPPTPENDYHDAHDTPVDIPVVLLSGFTEAETGALIDAILASGIRKPAFAMIPDTMHSQQVGEYLSIIRDEHRLLNG